MDWNMVQRKPIFSFIEDDEPELVNCPYCEKVGTKIRLVPRVYPEDHPAPYDADNWLQCTNCGRVIPVVDTKQDVEYGPVVDMVESKFESGSQFASTTPRKKKKRVPRSYKHDVDPDMAGETGEINILYDSSGNY